MPAEPKPRTPPKKRVRPTPSVTLSEHSLSDQVYHLLAEKIEAGSFQVGEYLPSKREMAIEFGFSTNPIHRALSRLESEGYVRRIHGSGVRVQSLAPVKRSAQRFPIIDFITSIENLRFAVQPDQERSHVFNAIEGWLWWHLNGAKGIRVTLATLNSIYDDKEFISRLKEAEELRPTVLAFCQPEAFSNRATQILRRLKSKGTHVVYYATRRNETDFDRVASDFSGGQYQLTRHLLKKDGGCVLRFVTNPDFHFEKLKQVGFVQALQEAGHNKDVADKWTLAHPRHYDSLEDAVEAYRAILRPWIKARPRGIMAPTDAQVPYIRLALKKLKASEIEVTGYDATWKEIHWDSPYMYRNWLKVHPEIFADENRPASVDTQLPLAGKAMAELISARANHQLPSEPQFRLVPQKIVGAN